MVNAYFRTPPVVKNLIIINLLVYMATALLPVARETIMHYCALQVGPAMFGFEFRAYQFITYMFLHANFEHIFFNMFALWMFGRTLEYELGSQRFLTYYMICGIGAALIQAAIAWGMGEPMVLVGASGAVMGLLLAFGVIHPNAVIMLLIPPIPIKAKWFVIIYGVIELFLGWRGVGNVAHFAHVGGMLWGLGLLFWWRRRGIIRF
ncbi:rhomboid family intramembrane serine protease [Alistipes sp.]|uniref:rhomboid family intramembrane serine protease n=1 Tax=Alistipes sp. TaxID=1872444 RepID=UPI003AF1051D